GGNLGSQLVVSPLVTATFTLTGAGVGNCVSSIATLVVVQPLPVLTVSSNVPVMCAGSTAILSATGAQTYFWQPIALNGASIAVSPLLTTLYNVIGTSAAGCTATALFTQTVNPAPLLLISASKNPVCIGDKLVLTVTGAQNYTWQPG